MQATTFRGYTDVTGQISLEQLINGIKSSEKVQRLLDRISFQMHRGDEETAKSIKMQLPFITLTSNFSTIRQGCGILTYNGIITIDIDYLEKDVLATTRKIIESDPNTLICFLSPRQSGLKVFMWMDTPQAERMRKRDLSGETIDYRKLDKHHAQMYDMTKEHIERITGIKVDTTGRDIGRGFYMSQDKNVYVNEELLAKVKPLSNIVNRPPKDEKKQRGSKAAIEPMVIEDKKIDHHMEIAFKKAIDVTRKKHSFKKGSRNTFINYLGGACYKRKIPFEQALVLTMRKYGNGGINISKPLNNGYIYTSKIDEAEKERKRPMMEQLTEFLNENYAFRYNLVAERMEVAKLGVAMEGKEKPLVYKFMDEREYNTVYLETQLARINVSRVNLKAIINSSFSPEYNPFVSYFEGLPKWDGVDHITKLADMVTTTNQEVWRTSLLKWLVGLVACATQDKAVNQHALMLYSSGQGIGKSSWVQRLLPPELADYQRIGMVEPKNKDHAMLLSTHLLINIDEFDGVKRSDLAALKRIITLDSVNERKAYAADTKMMVRRASFIASTNNQKCLQDMEGNRRFLLSTVLSVDLTQEINYNGVYAQAYHLLKSNYRYWYTGEEIVEINTRNEDYRMKEPAEELFYVHFRKASAADYMAKWYPAAHIMSYLGSVTRLGLDVYTQNTIVRVLERDGFCKRTGTSGLTEYQVLKLSFEEVESEAKYKAKA